MDEVARGEERRSRRSPPSGAVGVDLEMLVWEPRADDGHGRPRSALSMLGEPYEAAVPRPLASVELAVSPSVEAAADDARAAIVRFDAEVSGRHGLAGSSVLPAIMLRSESLASSAIEGYWASVEDIASLEIATADSSSTASSARIVSRNMAAMRAAVDVGMALDTQSLLGVHEILMRPEVRADPGVLRTQPVWIGGVGDYPHGAQFVPPRHERVPSALDDLWAFAVRTDIPVLTQVAVAHAQFETIHPFNDGNGRVGRALVQSMLRAADPTLTSVVPLSNGLLADTDRYVRALEEFRRGDPDPIVSCFVSATFVGVGAARRLIADLDEIQESWTHRAVGRAGSASRRLLPLLSLTPVVTANLVAEHLGVTWASADRALKLLTEAGVLARTDGARRNKTYVATDVTSAYESFSAGTRRPAAWPQAPAWGLD